MRFCPECQAQYGIDVERCPRDGAPLLAVPDKDEPPLERNALQRLQPVEAGNSRYTIISKIGQGGWGGVYRAYQHSTKREVALKVLRQEVAHDNLARKRFHREAEAVSQLKHPNTVTIFDFGETGDGLLFLAMEYIEGRSLDAVLHEKGTLQPLRAIRIARQIAQSLAEAHEKGIVHRDIKPHNIMLTHLGDGEDFVKVLDFGVAKLVSVESNLTTTGATFGTPEYMSPEQVQSKDIDARSDLYALGIILYQMLAGAPPFSGNSAVTVALSHVRKRPPPIRGAGDVPKPLRGLVRRLLAKSPGDRPQTARAVAAELDRVERLLITQVSQDATQAFQNVATAMASNWVAALTLFGVVCLSILAFVVLKDRVLTERTVPTADARSEPVRQRLDLAAPDLATPSVSGGPVEQAGDIRIIDDVTGIAPARDAAPVDVRAEPLPDALAAAASDLAVVPDIVVATDVAIRPDVRSEIAVADVTASRPARVEDVRPSPRPELVRQAITANVEGADVFRDGRMACETPCELEGRPGERVRLKVLKKGFVTARRRLTFAPDAKPLYIELQKVRLSDEDGLKVAPTPAEEDGLK